MKNTHADKTTETKSNAVANVTTVQQVAEKETFQIEDNRPQIIAQRKIQEAANNSTQVKQLKATKALANNSIQAKQLRTVQTMANDSSSNTIQLKEMNAAADNVASGDLHTIQRVVIIGKDPNPEVTIDNAFLTAMVKGDFKETVLGKDIKREHIVEMLKGWISLSKTKKFATKHEAVVAARDAIKGHETFVADEEVPFDGATTNAAIDEAYETAGFNKNRRGLLLSVIGEDSYRQLGDGDHLDALKDLFTSKGILAVETLASDTDVFETLVQLPAYETILDTVGSNTRLKDIISRIGDEANSIKLFTGMAAENVNKLPLAVIAELATKSAPQIRDIESNFVRFRSAWLDTAANLNLLITIATAAAPYTFTQCASLAVRECTPTQARAFQLAPITYAVLLPFIDEARKYNLPWANMMAIVNANIGAAIGALTTAIRNIALIAVVKGNNFPNWISNVVNLVADLDYTLTVNAEILLPGDPVTYEKRVDVATNTGVAAGYFMVHRHPGVGEADMFAPKISGKHLKPERAGDIRMNWSVVPPSIKAVI